MEPLDTDMEYATSEPRPATPGSRFNAMLIFPAIGLLLVLIFIAAAIFQLDLSDLVDSMVGLFLLLFVVMIAMLFWAFAAKTNRA